jgi:hypothetical protein
LKKGIKFKETGKIGKLEMFSANWSDDSMFEDLKDRVENSKKI